MSADNRQHELRRETRKLLQGTLKHVRATALAAALVPVASLAVATAVATVHGSGGTGSVPVPCDFTTSGGYVFGDTGKKANFGAHGGCKHGEFWGHVNYVDHATGYHLDSIQITGYLTPSEESNIRDICGLATTSKPSDPQPVYFRVRLIDNGEPGVSDQFGIRLSNVSNDYVMTTRFLAGGGPGGGNVQRHDANPSTTGPESPPNEDEMCNGVAAP